MRLKTRSVRTLLTLWHTGVLSLIVLLFSSGTYLFVRSSLFSQIDGRLEKYLATVERVLGEHPSDVAELMEYGSVPTFRVLDGEQPLAASDSWQEADLDKALAGGAFPSPASRLAGNGRPFRLLGAAVTRPGHRYRIAVAVDEAPARQLLGLLMSIMLAGLPVAVALALAGGYLLAGRALAPVSAITDKAREITAERLSERLPVENPDDEFGSLATVFNETFARLEDAFERMRRFTADASHELRTPLTALRSVGEVGLQESRDATACREVIGSMLEEADRLTRLVGSLLSLSRADAGTMPLVRERADLGELAGEVVDCLQVLAEEKEQSLTLEAGEGVTAEIDRTTLRQTLLNLVDNAVKYTPRRGHIGVAVRKTAAGEAVVEVGDDGPGISREHRERIFDRFYRVDKGRSRELGGAGLGLAIARWAVEINGGRIELESAEGRGSTFRIILPEGEGGKGP